VWPTEEFELVRSFVDSGIPEDDLFAGVGVRDGRHNPNSHDAR
jgi:mycothiol S-conjugate amidase